MAIKKTGKTAAEKITVTPDNIKVDRAKEFDNSISFDITLFGCVKIYGCSYRTFTEKETSEEKAFISFPSKKGKDDKYYNHAYFQVTPEVLEKVEKEIEALI
ncbi:MAG: hypothetical protein J6R32_02455 [Bacteroidales bacterium]|nr:hypothetical protein [Bacteroidales bacterium]